MPRGPSKEQRRVKAQEARAAEAARLDLARLKEEQAKATEAKAKQQRAKEAEQRRAKEAEQRRAKEAEQRRAAAKATQQAAAPEERSLENLAQAVSLHKCLFGDTQMANSAIACSVPIDLLCSEYFFWQQSISICIRTLTGASRV